MRDIAEPNTSPLKVTNKKRQKEIPKKTLPETTNKNLTKTDKHYSNGKKISSKEQEENFPMPNFITLSFEERQK